MILFVFRSHLIDFLIPFHAFSLIVMETYNSTSPHGSSWRCYFVSVLVPILDETIDLPMIPEEFRGIRYLRSIRNVAAFAMFLTLLLVSGVGAQYSSVFTVVYYSVYDINTPARYLKEL